MTTPVLGLIVIPAGALESEKANAWAGASASEADAVKVSVWSSLAKCAVWTVRIGSWFCSVTLTKKLLVVEPPALSFTRKLIVC